MKASAVGEVLARPKSKESLFLRFGLTQKAGSAESQTKYSYL